MKDFIYDLVDSYEDGVIRASTTWRKTYRSFIVYLFLSMFIGCLVLMAMAFSAGAIVPAFTFILSGLTFLVQAMTLTFAFATTERFEKSAKELEELAKDWERF